MKNYGQKTKVLSFEPLPDIYFSFYFIPLYTTAAARFSGDGTPQRKIELPPSFAFSFWRLAEESLSPGGFILDWYFIIYYILSGCCRFTWVRPLI